MNLNNIKTCSFCNLFFGAMSMMKELQRNHLRNGHDLNYCSFCNIFTAVVSMLGELQRDHVRKGQNGCDPLNIEQTENKSLSESSKVNVINNVSLKQGDVKSENLINKENQKFIFLKSKLIKEEDNVVGNYGFVSDEQGNLNFVSDDVNITKKNINDSANDSNFINAIDKNSFNNDTAIVYSPADIQAVINDNDEDNDSIKSIESFQDHEGVKNSINYTNTKQSIVWYHFKINPSIENGRECQHCGKVLISPYGTTSNLRKHLKNHHPDKWESQLLSKTINTSTRFKRNVNKSKKIKRSLVWKHFKSLPDGNGSVECNYCGTKLARSASGTSSMIKHVKVKHPDHLGTEFNGGNTKKNKKQLMKKESTKIEQAIETFNRKRLNKTSIFWGHFAFLPDKDDEGQCKYCDYFGKLFLLKQHLRKFHPERINKTHSIFSGHFTFLPNMDDKGQCKYCDYFGKLSHIKPHLRKDHPEKLPKKALEKWTCQYCGKIFLWAGGMRKHIKIVHLKITSFTCELCGKIFVREDSFRKHIHIHAKVRPFKCTHCERGFNTNSRKNTHERTHMGIFNFSCAYCSKQFTTNMIKIQHERIHTGEKPYLCTMCGKAFSVQTRLDNHVRTHTNENPYRCPMCANNYRYLRTYRNHHCIPININGNDL